MPSQQWLKQRAAEAPAHNLASLLLKRHRDYFYSDGVDTRLTNAFSKKIENHAAAVAPHFIHYKFARIHKTLRITSAMAA